MRRIPIDVHQSAKHSLIHRDSIVILPQRLVFVLVFVDVGVMKAAETAYPSFLWQRVGNDAIAMSGILSTDETIITGANTPPVSLNR